MGDESERPEPQASAPDMQHAPNADSGEMEFDKPFYEYWNQRDFVRWMGARITHSANGEATCFLEAGDHHRGAGVGGRAVTGAVQAYIFDIVTGAAVASLLRGTRPQVTVALDMTYEYPAYDAPLTFDARVLAGGKQLLFVEGECRDVNGRVCSRVRAIYRRFEQRLDIRPDIKV